MNEATTKPWDFYPFERFRELCKGLLTEVNILPDGQFLPDDADGWSEQCAPNNQKINILRERTCLAQGLLPELWEQNPRSAF